MGVKKVGKREQIPPPKKNQHSEGLTLTCWAPLSLLRVRSSSECATQTSCSAARSRGRSVLKCSVVSGSSGTFYKQKGCLLY